ncbi:Ribosomal L18p/L5e family protein [Striga hermonthica]|uniref:Ribosomal L18p/L5e family protein n=1 Tax=Striga hermonthica TaxID=68872 RepID=A0A9N7N2H4_STRHE|nr:Ribosomal L18p/L5e family protein [Striga hermonthica]
MAIGSCFLGLKLQACGILGTGLNRSSISHMSSTNVSVKPLVIQARANQRTESPKIRDRRLREKFNGTATRPRLSVFCSKKQLYAMLVDDQKKKCLFYGSTLQKSMQNDQLCSTAEAAKRVGEELIKMCVDLNINEISSYDRNGLAYGLGTGLLRCCWSLARVLRGLAHGCCDTGRTDAARRHAGARTWHGSSASAGPRQYVYGRWGATCDT